MSAEEVLLEFFIVLIVVGLLSGIVIAANLADRDRNPRLRNAVLTILLITNGLVVLVYGVLQPTTGESDSAARAFNWGAFLGALLVGGLATALLFRGFRARIARLFPHPAQEPHDTFDPFGDLDDDPDELADSTPPHGEPLFPQMLNYYTTSSILLPPPVTAANAAPPHRPALRGFDPQSVVHVVALVFLVYMLGVQFITFFQDGGLSGVADSLEGSINGWSLVINMLPLVVIPVLGVGFPTRRTLRDSLDRLGLTRPTAEGLGVAALVTLGLFMFVIVVSSIWMGLVSDETFKKQTEASDALSSGVTTLGLAFLLAMVAAVGEEIAFRGALQPVIGFWPTAIVFALTHSQYTLTPAWLIILGVAVGFGWLRRRYNTTVAILTHFTYNFIPLAISVYATGSLSLGLPWMF